MPNGEQVDKGGYWPQYDDMLIGEQEEIQVVVMEEIAGKLDV